jgi:hypothetical protein
MAGSWVLIDTVEPPGATASTPTTMQADTSRGGAWASCWTLATAPCASSGMARSTAQATQQAARQARWLQQCKCATPTRARGYYRYYRTHSSPSNSFPVAAPFSQYGERQHFVFQASAHMCLFSIAGFLAERQTASKYSSIYQQRIHNPQPTTTTNNNKQQRTNNKRRAAGGGGGRRRGGTWGGGGGGQPRLLWAKGN